MYKLFFQNIAKHIHLNQDEEEKIKAKLQFHSLRKNEKILRTGSYCKKMYFVCNGCLRIFQENPNGEEINVLFCPEKWWASDVVSFFNGFPASYSIDCLEDTELISISNNDLELLCAEIPKMERFFRILFQNGFALYQQRLTLVLSTSAEIRYSLFKKQYPGLMGRISQKHIASYLGITPVFLSSIKRKSLK